MAAPTQIAFRTLKGIGLLDAAPLYQPVKDFERPEGNLRCSAYSPCGRYFAWASPERVTIIDPSVGHVITTLPADNVFELGFSPLGTYVITWQRPSKDENGDAVKNLKVWSVEALTKESEGAGENAVVGRFVQKSQTGWNLQYTSDECYCARVVTNEVQFYKSHDLSNVWNKLRVEGVADFALSPGKSQAIAVFTPERKGQPASVKVFVVPQFNNPVSQKTFFKGDKVQLKWNNSGTSVIVLAQTDVDRSGKSYYGETTLYLLSATGAFDSRIDLDREGPIHDVTWSPNSKEFGVVYGFMPAKTTIFNFRGIATHSYPLAPRNTIVFSPHGRFVVVAGFGNLAGQMDIYDLEKGHQKITTIEGSNATVCEWSPDGKHILTATTSPRLRVDNGVRIWHVTGALQYNEDMSELYQVCWRPQGSVEQPLGDPFHPLPTPHSSALEYLAKRKVPSKPVGAYRPPGARGQTTSLAFKREDEGGAAFSREGGSSLSSGAAASSVNGFGKPRRREVPGAEPVEFVPQGAAPGGGVALPPGAEAVVATGAADEKLSKSAAKNKKKREAKKAKETADKEGELSAAPQNQNLHPSPDRREHRSKSRNRSRAESNVNGSAKAAKIAATAAAAAPAAPTAAEPNPTQDKRIRGLLKKLRAIDELKMRLASGEKLEDTQMKKIQTEDSVRKELEGLGYNV
ncbi:eukaryotic translation initiation factor subunit eIF2A, putative [Talaromyces stipitatus ATCC 10500]|uniref:Eukaryotic translation initiation factor 2A n=1 Tax=Talaromyces stipitatus (strain ATCC 10500 / CBS 375.48 / QM 6759 / NRRL 1006) TaxID=441959 RepID=B8MNG7_TALSN|nr:eukaryotic translation initiation factor subunit eIF2A, putative [Talaromyces stipitatus ATCC 10500]EED14056.1 eukaryotic translation initiation factor subunit eIF2A, putative [Talaromyces stipitatus ATCC 10500]